MSKILFVASDYKPWPGGIAEFIDSLARGFMGLGETVTVAAVVRPDEKERIRFLEAYEPWVIPFPLSRDQKPQNPFGRKLFSTLEVLRCKSPRWQQLLDRSCVFNSSVDSIERFKRLLSKEKPEAIIFGHLDVRLYPLALCLLEQELPYVIIAHDSEICQLPDSGRNDLVLRGMMLHGSRWIAANSRHTKSLMEVWRIPASRVKVIYPPISQDAIKESSVVDPMAHRHDQFTLVTICRLVKGKGVDLVVRALDILNSRGIPFRYFIGGEGPERESLEAMVDSFGFRDRVYFMGSVAGQEKWQLLRMGDVFVTPSRVDSSVPWQEGFGIAFVEAAAFGLPAVGSRSGGIPEAVIDGETGILVPEESYVDLADALTSLYREPETRDRMGKAARKRAHEQFSPGAIANCFREEISKTIHH